MKKLTTLLTAAAILLSISGTSFAFSLFGNDSDKAKANNAIEENSSLETVTLNLPGMFCATCPFTVRKSLEKLHGIRNVETSLKTRTAIVQYDPKKVSIEKMIEATTNAGYPSTVKE